MKTNYFSSSKSTLIINLILGFSMVMVSCGSYKNSTYYDRDGIYGSEEKENKTPEKNVDKYKEYFGSLREKNEQEQVFTDVENYTSIQDTLNSKSEKATTNYSGWGNNQQPINVTIYENNWGWNNYGYNSHWNYGWNWNLGWNSWYGPSIGYGWGWNNWFGPNYGYYGWGYHNFYNPYYGYYDYYGYNRYYGNPRYYSYSYGIRGRSSGRASGRYDIGRSGIANIRDNYSIGRGNSISNGIRNSDQNSPRSYNSIRNNDVNPRSENNNPRIYSPTRGETLSPRVGNETPRNYNPIRVESTNQSGEGSSPRSNAPIRIESSYPRGESSSPRSYTPSSSYGGGSYGGGGRSGGSGGGGRR